MKRLVIVVAAMLASVASPARSAAADVPDGNAQPQAIPVAPSPPFAPAEAPPPPPARPPAPPPQTLTAGAQPAPAGQWVYTQQYGWLWMPYGDAYSYVPPDGEGEPYAYAYYPAYGWIWVVAPWMWGFGPWPYFGVVGPAHFGWYLHGWWRSPWRWHLRLAPFGGGFAFHGLRPAPVRMGAAAPAGRGLVARGHVGGGGRGRGGHR